jgi:hypothetical protein
LSITEIEADEIEEARESYLDINRTTVVENAGKQELFEKWLSQM